MYTHKYFTLSLEPFSNGQVVSLGVDTWLMPERLETIGRQTPQRSLGGTTQSDVNREQIIYEFLTTLVSQEISGIAQWDILASTRRSVWLYV